MQSTNWIGVARGFSPSIPSVDRLKEGGDLVSGSIPMTGALATGLAAAAYRIKNGESGVLALPPLGGDSQALVADYLHGCRIEAMAGLVRAPWLQPQVVAAAPDLILWTRNLQQKRRFGDYREKFPLRTPLNPVFVGKNGDFNTIANILDGDDKLLRTIVCQHDFRNRSLCEALAARTSPFVIVIDATPWGVRDYLGEFITLLREFFPGTPRLVLTAIGDEATARTIERVMPDWPRWQTGRSDPALFGKHQKRHLAGRVVRVPDRPLNERLGSIYRQLKILESQVKAPGHKDVYSGLMRAWRQFLSLSVPIGIYELRAAQERRGGLFPVRPLSEIIRSARKTRGMPSGSAQAALEQACDEMVALIAFLEDGRSGKEQALIRWIDATLEHQNTGLIITSSAREAGWLRHYLLSTRFAHAVTEEKTIQVLAAGSVRELYQLEGPVDRVLVPSSLWHTDYWVAGLSNDFTWLCYPIQEAYTVSTSHFVTAADGGLNDGSLVAWWTGGRGGVPSTAEPLPVEEWADCVGQYKSKEKFSYEFAGDEDWVKNLFEDLQWHECGEQLYTKDDGTAYVVVHFGDRTELFEPNERVDLLDESESTKENFERRQARDLRPGDVIVFQDAGENDADLLDIVMEAVYGNAGELEVIRQYAAQWQTMLYAALKNSSRNDRRVLEKKLEHVGVTRQTLNNWLNGRNTIGKHKDTIIPEVARLAGDAYSEKSAQIVRKCIGELQGKRSAAGRILHKARLALLHDEAEIEVNGETLPIDLLADAICFEEVLSVHLPEESEEVTDPPFDLVAEVDKLVNESQGKLILNGTAGKLLKDCQYERKQRAHEAVKLMRDKLWPVYFAGAELQAATRGLEEYGITFRGDTAAVTQGVLNDVYRSKMYKGYKADLGKHIRIGNSRSPKRCFCVYFEVDEKDKGLVLHAMGAHLRTLRD